MADATQQPNNDELEVLRRTNGELVAKNTTRKAKIKGTLRRLTQVASNQADSR